MVEQDENGKSRPVSVFGLPITSTWQMYLLLGVIHCAGFCLLFAWRKLPPNLQIPTLAAGLIVAIIASVVFSFLTAKRAFELRASMGNAICMILLFFASAMFAAALALGLMLVGLMR